MDSNPEQRRSLDPPNFGCLLILHPLRHSAQGVPLCRVQRHQRHRGIVGALLPFQEAGGQPFRRGTGTRFPPPHLLASCSVAEEHQRLPRPQQQSQRMAGAVHRQARRRTPGSQLFRTALRQQPGGGRAPFLQSHPAGLQLDPGQIHRHRPGLAPEGAEAV